VVGLNNKADKDSTRRLAGRDKHRQPQPLQPQPLQPRRNMRVDVLSDERRRHFPGLAGDQHARVRCWETM